MAGIGVQLLTPVQPQTIHTWSLWWITSQAKPQLICSRSATSMQVTFLLLGIRRWTSSKFHQYFMWMGAQISLHQQHFFDYIWACQCIYTCRPLSVYCTDFLWWIVTFLTTVSLLRMNHRMPILSGTRGSRVAILASGERHRKVEESQVSHYNNSVVPHLWLCMRTITNLVKYKVEKILTICKYFVLLLYLKDCRFSDFSVTIRTKFSLSFIVSVTSLSCPSFIFLHGVFSFKWLCLVGLQAIHQHTHIHVHTTRL
jgi:hypothetical protein